MPRTLYDARARAELLARFDRLRPDATPRWGRMDAPRMVAHLLEAYRMPSGELRIKWMPLPFRALLRYLMLYVLPFPKGAPTARQLLARPPGTWTEDHARLRAAIESTCEPAPGAPRGDHPIFGAMSVRDWGVLMYKHTDHHLRQFGV